MSVSPQTRLLQTSEELWDYLCRNGGLDTEFYDCALDHDLRMALDLPEAGDLRLLLREAAISTDCFLGAFFGAVEPYAQMMGDLLKLFERAAAQRTDNNVAIEFDFGAHLPQLDFDIRSFRQWMERWQRAWRS